MSYNGSGTFQINTSGQPVVAGTVISSTAFNALTADLATGLSTAITKDGQTTTTARIPFAAGINSSLTTDSSSTTTGSIITAGGIGAAKALFVGTTANVAGAATLGSTLTYGGVTLTNAVTGTGKMVLDTSPTLVTPVLGAASATSITVAAGTVSDPAITTTGDTNTGIFFPAADTIAFAEGGAEIARFNSSGNLGIGTSSPAVKLDINGITGWAGATTGQTAQIVGASSGIGGGGNFRVLSNTTQAVDVGGALTLGGYYTTTTASVDFASILGAKENSTGGNTAGYLAFGTRPNAGNMTERMRIDSSGNLLVGTTSNSLSTKVFVSGSIGAQQTYGPMFVSNENNTDNVGRSSFNFQRGGTLVGQIVTTNSTCAYNSVSDYRLKENIAPMIGALGKVAQLKPCTFTWKSNSFIGQGFIAHELQEVVPDCVTGEKDAVDAEGNPQYQGIDTSFLVATLTAAIQELKALVDTQASTITQLQADVAALKGTS